MLKVYFYETYSLCVRVCVCALSKDKMANPDFPIRYNPFISKQSHAKV